MTTQKLYTVHEVVLGLCLAVSVFYGLYMFPTSLEDCYAEATNLFLFFFLVFAPIFFFYNVRNLLYRLPLREVVRQIGTLAKYEEVQTIKIFALRDLLILTVMFYLARAPYLYMDKGWIVALIIIGMTAIAYAILPPPKDRPEDEPT